ncbi:Receptor-type guanylate cyclase Gyc76C [Bulinus truncatus]|nr:Receptor-type guanylate cyclase Gyc76C [Bulinus truncatus]
MSNNRHNSIVTANRMTAIDGGSSSANRSGMIITSAQTIRDPPPPSAFKQYENTYQLGPRKPASSSALEKEVVLFDTFSLSCGVVSVFIGVAKVYVGLKLGSQALYTDNVNKMRFMAWAFYPVRSLSIGLCRLITFVGAASCFAGVAGLELYVNNTEFLFLDSVVWVSSAGCAAALWHQAAQDSIANDVIIGLQQEVDGLTDALVVSISVMVVAVILFPLVILAVYRLTNRIQAYAQTLQERTRDLDIERKRSENLLYELLPVSVAQKLLNHQDVPPVSYPAVTIFFSDIVGFTNICSKSTPFQVIDMLNSLYRMFDDIIDSYDVYKVETIGDAYMVASGLPHENVEGHAVEMADMALDLRDQLCQKTVQHLPGESLRMRIGLNCGPVVAGVVGHKMPRYCLFGDTVNVASRMESTSLPLKIQITDRCRIELESKGDYIITERGKVEIKGKGLMTTYWLVGKQHHEIHNSQQHLGRT